MRISRSYSGVRADILGDFSALLDYIWKSPRFVEYEAELEERKLEEYFPEEEAKSDPRIALSRSFRRHFENEQIGRFPRYIATSNLFLATSVFEHYLYAVCRGFERLSDCKIADQRGNGCERSFRFLEKAGLKPRSPRLYPQVDAALTIRNTLLHANGDLRLSRERQKVEDITKRKLFMERGREKNTGIVDDWGHDEVLISFDGDHININNFYSYRAAAQYREYLLDISKPLYPEDSDFDTLNL